MTESWTLADLVAEASARLAALPPPKNGQVRAVPDDRTIRYYAAIGLLDKPAAMRGRTALYGSRHLAQVVAIKRMQAAGKSLTEIRELWPVLSTDDLALARMSGVQLPAKPRAARKDFWKHEAISRASDLGASAPLRSTSGTRMDATEPEEKLERRGAEAQRPDQRGSVEVRIEIAPGAYLAVGIRDGASLTSADVRALRAAARPLVTELANRGLIAHVLGTLEEEP